MTDRYIFHRESHVKSLTGAHYENVPLSEEHNFTCPSARLNSLFIQPASCSFRQHQKKARRTFLQRQDRSDDVRHREPDVRTEVCIRTRYEAQITDCSKPFDRAIEKRFHKPCPQLQPHLARGQAGARGTCCRRWRSSAQQSDVTVQAHESHDAKNPLSRHEELVRLEETPTQQDVACSQARKFCLVMPERIIHPRTLVVATKADNLATLPLPSHRARGNDMELLFFFSRLRLHARHTVVRFQPKANQKRTNLAADGEDRNKHNIGESVRRLAPEKPKPSHRSITSAVLRQSGDKSRTRTRGTTRSSLCNWAWTP